MRIADLNWMQVQAQARADSRAVLPIGSTEQHGYLSLSVDSILAERVAIEAAEPLMVPVFPVLPYGLTPGFIDFPGTVSIRLATYGALLRDILSSILRAGFRRIVIVNGHGGNSPAQTIVHEWLDDHRGVEVKWHNWWNAPRTMAKVQAIDPVASHASWMENFPWTRLGNIAQPSEQKPLIDMARLQRLDPGERKTLLGDGNFGGFYQRPDAEMLAIWEIAVAETRSMIDEDWG